MITPTQALELIVAAMDDTIQKINSFTHEVLHTRGGRIGSGMGTLIEALWGYYINQVFKEKDGIAVLCEIGWLIGHEYNDFACIHRDQPWNSEDRSGEIFRIEAKSMNIGADESKGHFDALINEIDVWDQLLILVWKWENIDEIRVYPKIQDYFLGSAQSVARLRDRLHSVRRGSFVDRNTCPDGCDPVICPHHGEPLNSNGKRERVTGPESTRPSLKVSYAANFGGLVRMLKTESEEARIEFRRARREDDIAHEYISFIHRNFPYEESNQYMTSEWQRLASQYQIRTKGLSKEQLIELIRKSAPDYQNRLRHSIDILRGFDLKHFEIE